MSCELQNGRGSVDDCTDQIAGVKTVYFFRHSLLDIQKNLAGEITYIGAGDMYRFEQDQYHGLALQEIIRGQNDTQYVRQQTDMTLFYITPEFIQTIQYLKRGLWAIFFLDYEDKIRLLGEFTPMYQLDGVDQSGKKAGESFWSNLSFEGISNSFAPFLEDFTDYPFDNFEPDIIMHPRYDTAPGLLTYNNAGEYYKWINFPNNRLDYKG